MKQIFSLRSFDCVYNSKVSKLTVFNSFTGVVFVVDLSESEFYGFFTNRDESFMFDVILHLISQDDSSFSYLY